MVSDRYLAKGKMSDRYLAKGKVSVTFAHDLFLGVGLLIQDAQLIIAVYEHDARVVAVFHRPLILLHIINIKVITKLLTQNNDKNNNNDDDNNNNSNNNNNQNNSYNSSNNNNNNNYDGNDIHQYIIIHISATMKMECTW